MMRAPTVLTGATYPSSVIARGAKRAVAAEADALVAIQLDCFVAPQSGASRNDKPVAAAASPAASSRNTPFVIATRQTKQSLRGAGKGPLLPDCHSERSEESTRRTPAEPWILHYVQNDKRSRPTRQRGISTRGERGSILIIVMWICFGLVALTLYFASSMNSEMQAAENRTSEIAARQALEGGERYAVTLLTQYGINGKVPDLDEYRGEAMPVGESRAKFWFIGRDRDISPSQQAPTEPYFALVDEASKLNLNTVNSAMIQALGIPDMTPEFADAIVAWRTANSQAALLAETYYTQLDPPRHNKGAPYESVDELRLVQGSMLKFIFGEDTNRNGLLDANENDGDASAPRDDQDGQLLAGLLEHFTVYSSEPATGASGSRRINVTTLTTQQARQSLQTRLTQVGIAQQRATQILARFPFNAQNPQQTQAPTSVADFMVTGQLTAEEWELVHTELTAATATTGIATGLVNVNTASYAVLSAIPGIGPENATSIVAFRATNPDLLTNFAWLTQVMTPTAIRNAGRFITDQSYQFTADVAAVSASGRGYCREKIVIDMSTGKPRITFRQDLTGYGWALGATTRRIVKGTDNS